MANGSTAEGIAIAFLVADWNSQSMVDSAQGGFSKPQEWLGPLAGRALNAFEAPPELDVLSRWIAVDPEFRRMLKVNNIKSFLLHRVLRGQSQLGVQWGLPVIRDFADLAVWLGLERRELAWLADLHAPLRRNSYRRTEHYIATWIKKRSTGSRLIESPKPQLKSVQRAILGQMLDRIPTHSAAHGFCRRRNVVSFVEPHVGRPFCLKMDLQDFFPAIRFGRVWSLFRRAGYTCEVARYLSGLCTHAVDRKTILERNGPQTPFVNLEGLEKLYGPRHLPQGAPTSPALANLIAYRFDARLAGLAKSMGAVYTRYADDLMFSGDRSFGNAADRFSSTVGAIAIEEGFQIHYRKTRRMPASQRQSAAGVVINQTTNLRRSSFDELKATLYNCCRSKPDSQNRQRVPDFRAHLQGRIEWVRVLKPTKAVKLQALFDAIQW